MAALSAAEYERLLPHLEQVSWERGWTVYEHGSRQGYLYFPTDSIVSFQHVLQNGSSAEIAVVGNEGVVGISLFMGGEATPRRTVVQSAGSAYRLRSTVLKSEFDRGRQLHSLLLQYTQTLIVQIAQTAACNRHHSVDQQLCRWLLMNLDRLPTEELTMSHDLISDMLGVRRQSVTEAAGKLQADGVIQYGRGKIAVLDRRELERRACECYRVVKRESDRLLSPPHAIPWRKLNGRSRSWFMGHAPRVWGKQASNFQYI